MRLDKCKVKENLLKSASRESSSRKRHSKNIQIRTPRSRRHTDNWYLQENIGSEYINRKRNLGNERLVLVY